MIRLLWPKSLAGRLMVLVLKSLGVSLSIACLGTFLWMRSFLLDRVDGQLADSAAFAKSAIAQRVAVGEPPPASGLADGFAPQWRSMALAGLVPASAEIRDPANRTVEVIASGHPAPALPADPAARIPAGADHADFDLRGSTTGGGDRFRIRVDRLPDGGSLVLAMPVGDLHRTLTQLEVIEAALWCVAFAVVGWIVTRSIKGALRPLDRIGAEALAIRAGDLDRRVTPTDPQTEVGRLGIAVNTMLGRLEAAFVEREASEDRLRRFVADASHELRTPLTSIRGYAELFRRGAADRPRDLALAMARIESEAARMGALVDELLLLARLDSGRALAHEPVDLVRLAVEAIADFRVTTPDRPVELVADPVVVHGDQDRLRQVLANLLANLRRHTPAGTSARLTVGSRAAAAVIELADTGPGLTADQCTKVFERFYRVDAARTRSGEAGAGLGLAIVAAVAEAHGGVAEARPNPGGGLVISIRIPLA
ncbi:HAMP domain-containing sensor histidine kinase [Catenulispora subtropica]|uniref:histidine kinase n=1 Tax=Catenulispora subtropica TaxID=450798 RepID=A0ABN2RCB4_9ACTN